MVSLLDLCLSEFITIFSCLGSGRIVDLLLSSGLLRNTIESHELGHADRAVAICILLGEEFLNRLQVFLHKALLLVANEVPELNQGDAIIRAVDVDGVEELSRLHAPAFDQVNELLNGRMFEGDIAAAFRTRAHDMGFATDIIGLQRVLVLSVGDIVSTVLVKDVLKAVDLGLGQP